MTVTPATPSVGLRRECRELAGDHIRQWRRLVHVPNPDIIIDCERLYHLAAYTALAMVGTRRGAMERRRFRGRP